MGKRFTDTEKWKKPKTYLTQDHFAKNKWIILHGNDLRGLRDEAGCYVVYKDSELVYVGQSNRLRFRFAQHLSKSFNKGKETPWGDFKSIWVKVKYPKKYGYETMLEKRLIRRLQPSQNRYFKTKRKCG